MSLSVKAEKGSNLLLFAGFPARESTVDLSDLQPNHLFTSRKYYSAMSDNLMKQNDIETSLIPPAPSIFRKGPGVRSNSLTLPNFPFMRLVLFSLLLIITLHQGSAFRIALIRNCSVVKLFQQLSSGKKAMSSIPAV